MNTASYLIAFCTLLAACQPTYNEPTISLESYRIEDGFQLEILASEPFIEAPVAMDFDNQGRMWVAEMRGYMRDIEGSTEDQPTGVISILEDRDKDGVTDHAKIFLDKLVMPRAVAHVYGGLLYAEPPNLWFVEIVNDQPGAKTLVDSVYAVGGNPEHQPNGLMMNIDNWIYNANSNARYQRKDGKWIKETASMRGQWGITKDNMGRLYYNNNSTQLKGDYVLPNLLINNPHYKPKQGINKTLTSNQKVYPLIENPVNRGYIPGVLDKDSVLVRVTSACGPVIYRGGQFPDSYNENALVCVPEANLIKRNTLTFLPGKTTATQAWDNKEFLASTDPAFRPVNLFNGPDGGLYILDMHRGVIQHNAFLSPYLKEHIKRQQLDTILGMGRILRVTHQQQTPHQLPDFDHLNAGELVTLLHHTNGWIRDRAQQVLIQRKMNKAIPELISLLDDNTKPIAQVHALYTLQGLEALTFELLLSASRSPQEMTKIHALTLLQHFAADQNTEAITMLADELLKTNDYNTHLYLTFTLSQWSSLAPASLFPYIATLSNQYKEDPLIQETIISGLNEQESEYLNYMANKEQNSKYLNEGLTTALANEEKGKINEIYNAFKHYDDSRTKGMRLYKSICAACHGIDGLGIEDLAPPLHESEYVTGPVERLTSIILHGLHGPVTVNGKRYELNAVMPGLLNNKRVSDQDVSAIVSFVTSSFSRKPRGIRTEKIKVLRAKKPKQSAGYTEEELLNLWP